MSFWSLKKGSHISHNTGGVWYIFLNITTNVIGSLPLYPFSLRASFSLSFLPSLFRASFSTKVCKKNVSAHQTYGNSGRSLGHCRLRIFQNSGFSGVAGACQADEQKTWNEWWQIVFILLEKLYQVYDRRVSINLMHRHGDRRRRTTPSKNFAQPLSAWIGLFPHQPVQSITLY